MQSISKMIFIGVVATAALSGNAFAQDAEVQDSHYGHSHLRDIDVYGLEATPGTDNTDNAFIAPGSENGTAIGYGSVIGNFIPDSCGAGTLVSGACYDADQFEDDGVTLIGGATANGSFVPEHIDPVNNGTALGAKTTVTGNGSTAIGYGAVANRNDEIVLGHGGAGAGFPDGPTTVTIRGLTGDRAKARQEGPLELVTTDERGHIASDGGATHSAIAANAAGVAANYGLIEDNSAAIAGNSLAISKNAERIDEAFEGVAMALAMDTPDLDPGKTFGVSLNWGNFEGENAFAAAAKFRFDETWSATGGIGYGMSSNTLGGKAGIQAQW